MSNTANMIAVTGKGGVGKTTVLALIIKWLKENADGPILALDADPDANLATLLGIPVKQTIGDLRQDMLKQIKNFPAGMSKENYIEMGLHELIIETEKLDLITMGRGEGPGCYCFINNLLRKFTDDLFPSYQWIVMDNEAGIEHISRHTASRVDHLIVVVNENPLAMDCAQRIDVLLTDLKRDIRNKYYLLNAVRDDRVETVRNRMNDLRLEYLGSVPRDETIENLVFDGKSIFVLDNGPATRAIHEIMQRIGGG